jgi:hypothetical protein
VTVTRRRVVALAIAAIFIWSLVFLVWAVFLGSTGICNILQTVPTNGGTFVPLTAAEVQAKTDACNQLDPGPLPGFAFGYIVIVAATIAAYSRGGSGAGHEPPRRL